MASENEENSGRRTRSGRRVSAAAQPVVAVSPRSARRSSKKQVQEQLINHDAPEIIHEEQFVEMYQAKQGNTDIITEMLVEAAQGVNTDVGDIIFDGNEIVETVEEVVQEAPQYEECIVYVEQPVNDDEQDVEMYQEEQLTTVEVPVASDDKSSSFPFGTVGQSETSEDVQNEEEASAEINESGAAESSLLASLAGDNANSLPSVGGGEEVENKRDDFEAKVTDNIKQHCENIIESDDSLSEPAIAEDLGTGVDGSDDTIVNTEMVSEDELPLPTKPEINDAEEVSDDELPAPKRAELPADAEVISEDELPANSLVDKKSPTNTNTSQNLVDDKSKHSNSNHDSNKHKRKADDTENSLSDGSSCEKHKNPETSTKKNDEQYNPMSPTSESNDAPPVEKKCKLETSNNSTESEHKDRKREKEREHKEKDDKEKEKEKDKDKDKEREREKDKEKEKERERDKDKEKEKEKERKKLPDLDKYWRAVRDDPADFTGWTYLLHYVDNESDAEAAREAYDEFLSHYPYCYGYWRKYADYEKRKGVKANCNTVFQRGLEAIPLSVDLWIHYITHVRNNHSDNESYVRSQFERAIEACGLEFRSDKLWDAYIKWETEAKHYQRVVKIYDRLLAIPTQGYNTHFDSFQDLINQHSIASTVSSEELRKIRIELLDSNRSSRSKTHTHNKDSETQSTPIADEPNAADASDAAAVATTPTTTTEHNEQLADINTLSDEELVLLKDKVVSARRKVHKNTVAAVTARWGYEEGIKRPYFHVKPLERCQLKNWKDYLDFEIEKGDRKRILVLFERCLIACALYDEFWLKMIRYLETQLGQPNMVTVTSDVFRRACQIHHPDKPSLHLMWAAFEECQNNFNGAAVILTNLEKKCPHLLQVAYRRINVERRRGDFARCRELYEHYIANAKNKTIAGSLAIKYARFLNKICNDLDSGLHILRETLEKDAANTRVALQMIDLALQRPKVDEDEVVQIMDTFMARENMDPEQKVLFAQRKVEFLEDFGSTAKGLQDAQRALQISLNKANEFKKKRENSPNRKISGAGSSKDNVNMANPATVQAAYNNNGSTNNVNYNYGSSTNSSASTYYGQQNSGTNSYQQTYDGYYNHWQYGSGYSGYGQWSGYGNYY